MDISLNAPTATSVAVNFAALAGGATSVDIQVSPRADFKWCVAPIFNVPTASPYTIRELNQRQTYYIRAREIAAGVEFPWTPTYGFRTLDGTAQITSPAAIMIEPAILMRPIPILEWVSYSPAIAGFPASNLGRDAPVAWRSDADADTLGDAQQAYVVALRVGSAPIDTIALLNTNLGEDAVWLARGAADYGTLVGAGWEYQSATVPFRASANLPGRDGYHGMLNLGQLRSHTWWLISIRAVVPGNRLHAEHLVLGRNRKTKNMALEKNESALNLGSKERTRTGNPERVEGLKMRRVEFDVAWLTETQSETQYGDLASWLDEPVFAVPNSKAGAFLHDRMLYGDLKTARTTMPSSAHFTRTFAIDSLI